MKPLTAVIRKGQKVAQLPKGKTISLSSIATLDIELTIKTFKPVRSVAQNRLAWKWADYIGKAMGIDKLEVFGEFKDKHLSTILSRDDPDFAVIYEDFKGLLVGQESTPIYNRLAYGLIRSSDCKTSQMAEALTAWELAWTNEGASTYGHLPRPEDYHFALQAESYEQLSNNA